MMKFLRKSSPPVMAVSGIGLMTFGAVAVVFGVPPIPGLGPVETITAGFGLFTASFGVPSEAANTKDKTVPEAEKEPAKPEPELAVVDPETPIEQPNVQKEAVPVIHAEEKSAPPNQPVQLIQPVQPVLIQKVWIELAAFAIVAFCGTMISIMSLAHGNTVPAFGVLAVLSFIGFNRFFNYDST